MGQLYLYYYYYYYYLCVGVCVCVQQLPVAQGLLLQEASWITHNDAPQSVGLLWTSDQLVAETST